MFKNRLLSACARLSFIGMAMIVIFPQPVGAQFVSPNINQPAIVDSSNTCPFSAGELGSLHTAYNSGANLRMLVTADGPVGVDGGTQALRQCRLGQ